VVFLIPIGYARAAAVGASSGRAAAGGRRRTFQKDAALDVAVATNCCFSVATHAPGRVFEAALLQFRTATVRGGAGFQRGRPFREVKILGRVE
jgi:hypothetical protein